MVLSDLIDEDHEAIANCMEILADHMGGNKKSKGKTKAKN